MIRFSNVSTNTTNLNLLQSKNDEKNLVIKFSNNFIKKRENIPSKELDKIKETTKDIFPDMNINSKPHWGVAIWTLFHIIGEKVSKDNFELLKTDIILIIKQICYNLPCPMCTSHATDYLNKNNFDKINNISDFRLFLFNFHNAVNIKKSKPIFSIDELSTKYKDLDSIKVIRDFMVVFQDKHYNIHMIANDFHRNRMVIKFKTWFNQNINYLL